MDGDIIHNDDGLIWQSSAKATKEEAEVVFPYPFGLGIVGVEQIMIDEILLQQHPLLVHADSIWVFSFDPLDLMVGYFEGFHGINNIHAIP